MLMLTILKNINSRFKIKRRVIFTLKFFFIRIFWLQKANWFSALIAEHLAEIKYKISSKVPGPLYYTAANPILFWRAKTLLTKEPETIAWLDRMVANDVFFDIGANIGMYSIYAGKKKVNDPRNTLFREFVRFTEVIKPKVIIGENVKGLLSRKAESGDFYINIIVGEFEKLGYKCIFNVFKCHEYGVHQKRERLIILGVREDCLDEFKLEFPSVSVGADVSLKNIVKFNMMGAIKIEQDEFDMIFVF